MILLYNNLNRAWCKLELNFLILDTPILGHFHLPLKIVALYLIIAAFFILTLNILVTSYKKVVSNNRSISLKCLYATIHSKVIFQIYIVIEKKYYIYISLFVFIIINSLIEMKTYCFALPFNELILGLAFFSIIGIIKFYTILGFYFAEALADKSIKFISRLLYTLNKNKSFIKFLPILRILKYLLIILLILCLLLFIFLLYSFMIYYGNLALGSSPYLECAPNRGYIPHGYDIPDVRDELLILDRHIQNLRDAIANYHHGAAVRSTFHDTNVEAINCAKQYKPRLNAHNHDGINLHRSLLVLKRAHRQFRYLTNEEIDS